jgi:hypothetical protein
MKLYSNGKLLFVPTNIRIGLKGFALINALAYITTALIIAIKSFIELTPEVNII